MCCNAPVGWGASKVRHEHRVGDAEILGELVLACVATIEVVWDAGETATGTVVKR